MVYCNYCGLTFDVDQWWISEYHKMACRDYSVTGDPLRDTLINFFRHNADDNLTGSRHQWVWWGDISRHVEGLAQLEEDDMDERLNETRDLLVRENFVIRHGVDDTFYRFNYQNDLSSEEEEAVDKESDDE